jgi:hypothetical protein
MNDQTNPDSPCEGTQGLKWSEAITAVKPWSSACWQYLSNALGANCSIDAA